MLTALSAIDLTVDVDCTFCSHRKPAWTDRILFRFTKNAYENVALDLKQHQYVSHDLYIQSDHKPVSGFFSLKVGRLVTRFFRACTVLSEWMDGGGCATTQDNNNKKKKMWACSPARCLPSRCNQ